MNLISCEGCGVVMDKDKLHFATSMYGEDGIDHTVAAWNGREFSAFVPCPVCGDSIFEKEAK